VNKKKKKKKKKKKGVRVARAGALSPSTPDTRRHQLKQSSPSHILSRPSTPL